MKLEGRLALVTGASQALESPLPEAGGKRCDIAVIYVGGRGACAGSLP